MQLTIDDQILLLEDADYETYWKHYNRIIYRVSPRYPVAVAMRIEGKEILFHRLLLSPPDHLVVDHRNRNPLDNRRTNLRICTHSQNSINKKTITTGTSKYRGVSFKQANGKWQAGIRVDRKVIYLGLYNTELEAAIAYNRSAKFLHGEFAVLNEVS
jgi:hypothetical protein